MRKLAVAIGSMTLVAGAMAQDAFDCVNPDVLNALVFDGRVESRLVVMRELPGNAEGFGAPPEFTLIGSGIRGNNAGTEVAYRTDLDGNQALASLRQFLGTQGWQIETQAVNQLPTMTVAGARPLAVQLCRDGERRSLRVREVDGVRYANITGYKSSPPRACNAPVEQTPGFGDPMAAINTLRSRLPKISFPDTARMATGTGMDQTNLNSDSVSTAVRIESPDTAASLAEFIAAQVAEQGWFRDAGWNGKLSTGSSWTRFADDGRNYLGMLEILSLGGQVYNVEFTISNPAR